LIIAAPGAGRALSRPVAGLFLYAHRGASADAPENTLAAFRRAIAAGADGVELDVHLSADGVPMVIHDATLGRTTDGDGRVGAYPAAELALLDAGSWFAADYAGEPVPTLSEVLDLLAGKLRINIEIKDAAAALATLDALADFPGAEVILSAFDRAALHALRGVDRRIPLALLSDGGGWHRLLAEARALNASALHLRADLVRRPLVARFREAGLPVYAWTVDVPGEARSLARAGVAGLFTNDPAGLRAGCPRAPVYSS
jgi:glycerophosphoryl diester phosphodiesterase